VTYSEPRRLMSRRAWLGSAGVVAAAASAGALVALVRPDPVSGHPPGAPDWLSAALAREQQLLHGRPGVLWRGKENSHPVCTGWLIVRRDCSVQAFLTGAAAGLPK